MAELISDKARPEMAAAGLAPDGRTGYRPSLTSSDRVVERNKNSLAADAQDASRTNPYAKSALRTTADSVIGAEFQLQIEPLAKELGVTEEEAALWSEMVEDRWAAAARSPMFPMDAQRKQNFSGLMRTAYSTLFTAGEALGTIEWQASAVPSGQRTCLNLLAPERLSDPMGSNDFLKGRRMGVERNRFGAPYAYHIREDHPSDEGMWGGRQRYTWTRVPRHTYWGRENVLHLFEHDQPDMTRGLSAYSTALLPMRLLHDYLITELESNAIKATYAAVIESEMNYDDAMKVIGADNATAIADNPVLDFTLQMMADKAKFYRGQEFKFGKAKVAHLLPDEKLTMVQGTQNASAIKDFASINAYLLASALGVDYTSLTKDFSSTNYSGARAALYDVWRSYEVRRDTFISGFAWPFFCAWLEEMIALRGIIPMLGDKSFYEVRDYLCVGTFGTWTKPRLDPLKEIQADIVLYERGGLSLKDLCAADGRDWRKVLKQRALEKKAMKELELKPEDLDWSLIMNKGADGKGGKKGKGEGTGSEGGSSTGSSD